MDAMTGACAFIKAAKGKTAPKRIPKMDGTKSIKVKAEDLIEESESDGEKDEEDDGELEWWESDFYNRKGVFVHAPGQGKHPEVAPAPPQPPQPQPHHNDQNDHNEPQPPLPPPPQIATTTSTRRCGTCEFARFAPTTIAASGPRWWSTKETTEGRMESEGGSLERHFLRTQNQLLNDRRLFTHL